MFDLKKLHADYVSPLPRIESIPRGTYPFEVLGCDLQIHESSCALHFVIRPLAGLHDEKYLWIVVVRDEDSASNAARQLLYLGLEVEGVPIDKLIEGTPGKVRGRRFWGLKKLKIKDTGQVFHNFYAIRGLKNGDSLDVRDL